MPKVKLDPEEKKALRAQKKADKKLRAIETKKQIKRDRFQREVKYGTHTVKQHEQDWKTMLTNLAIPRIRDDLEFAWHNFERVVDCKDFTISLLMDELKDAEEQYMRNIKCHVTNIDKLIDMFHGQLQEMRKDHDDKVNKLINNGDKDEEMITDISEEQRKCIKTMLYGLETEKKEQDRTVRAQYIFRIDDEVMKNTTLIQRMLMGFEPQLRNLWNECIDFTKNYKLRTRKREKEQKTMKNQDEYICMILNQQMVQLKKGVETIKHLKTSFFDTKFNLGQILNELRTEYQYFENAFGSFKEKLKIDQGRDYQKLIVLTENFNKTKDHLQSLEEKGRRILQLAAVCRKLETKQEKLCPFPVLQETIQTLSEDKILFNEFVKQLDLFFQKVAQAEASQVSIFEEREFLKIENQILNRKIHAYCKCLTCPPDLPPIKRDSIPVTDGIAEIKKYLKQMKR